MSTETLQPQLEPTERVNQKTEAEVAAQINRIASKLGERAIELPDNISGFNADETSALKLDGVSLQTYKYGGQMNINTGNEQGMKRAVERSDFYYDVPTNRSEKVVLDKSFSGSGDNHPNYQNVQVNVSLDKRGGSVRSRYYTNQGGREKSTVLTLDQSKQAAASVLGHMRGEIAKRRIVAKKEMGDFLKA